MSQVEGPILVLSTP